MSAAGTDLASVALALAAAARPVIGVAPRSLALLVVELIAAGTALVATGLPAFAAPHRIPLAVVVVRFSRTR